MDLNLYLLRHGETEFSRNGDYCGNTDADLSENGKLMAEAFASGYKNTKWEAIYCSPMKRTIATANPISTALSMPLKLREGLKEINYGEWESKTQNFVKEHYASDYANWTAEPAWNAPTGGEKGIDIAERAALVISEIRHQYQEGNVLVVSHKATIRIIICSLLGIELGRYRDRVNVLVGSLNRISLTSHGPRLDLLGDRSYMPENLRMLAGT